MSEFSEIVKMLWEESSAYYGNSLANANTGPRYGDTTLNPDRKLTGKFQDYLTTVDVDDGFYTGGFRKECEEIVDD